MKKNTDYILTYFMNFTTSLNTPWFTRLTEIICWAHSTVISLWTFFVSLIRVFEIFQIRFNPSLWGPYIVTQYSQYFSHKPASYILFNVVFYRDQCISCILRLSHRSCFKFKENIHSKYLSTICLLGFE